MALDARDPYIDNFDAVVWAERIAYHWMAGSTFFRRTQDVAAATITDVGVTHQLAISYQDLGGGWVRITMCQDGNQIASYDKPAMTSWSNGDVEALFGVRATQDIYSRTPDYTHVLDGVAQGVGGYVDAKIEEVMIFDTVVSCAEVAGIPANVDSDGDGVVDDLDACPNEDASGYDANGDGCIDDTDGDGVGDDVDPCSGFPNDDTDGDGVCDANDVCPTDPNDTDADDDGVCDVVDVCMGSANVDSDGDQICDDIDQCLGNDASGDGDGDSVCNDTDNCADDPNPDQADADGDGIGDVCEADTDGDGVIDDYDNCVDDANADQSDNDGDGLGDACDDDDDGDGVPDAVDVCPFYADPDQTDTDGDGLGDVCDGDDDGDGVADEADLCPGTALDVPFDEQGCSGEQRIELACGTPEDYGWRRSHRFIHCVVHESHHAVHAGLLTWRERARIIRRAIIEVWRLRWRRRLRRWC